MKKLLFLFLVLSSPIFPDATCDKIKDYIFENLTETGVLKQDSEGFVYVDLDDGYINKLLEFIKGEGYVRPPYFAPPNGHGAHITVIYADEAQELDEIDELGKTIAFKIKACKVIQPPQHPELDGIYVITVDAPVLKGIRRKLGLRPPKYDFHITIGWKYREEEKKAA
ncbi:MAG TPA: hypothetical protein VLG44_06875 [Chlamydiales bacterium]|nr:hypothetical protein [Chlamydiales bacterium]